jgi:hypothetical protein
MKGFPFPGTLFRKTEAEAGGRASERANHDLGAHETDSRWDTTNGELRRFSWQRAEADQALWRAHALMLMLMLMLMM